MTHSPRQLSLLLAPALALLLPVCGSPTGGGPVPQPSPGPSCRDYATRMLLTRASVPFGLSGNGASECKFDRNSSALTCTENWVFANGCQLQRTTLRSYASVQGFVRDLSPAGRNYALSERQDDIFQGGCGGTASVSTTFSYDSQSRLTRRVVTGTTAREEIQFTAWDSSGRPNTGTMTDNAFCPLERVNGLYDDATRSWALDIGELSTVCGRRERWVIDANRNPTVWGRSEGAPPTDTTVTATIVATEQVCQ